MNIIKLWDNWHLKEAPQYPPDVLIGFILSNYKNFKGLSVIDFGSGNGVNSIFLAGLGFNVHSVDVSPEGINMLNDKLKDLKLNNCKTFIGDICKDLEFENNCDIAISIGVLDFLIDNVERINAFNNIFKSLKDKGQFLLVFTSDDDTRRLGQVEVREDIFEQHGYSRDEILSILSNFHLSELNIDKHICTKDNMKTQVSNWVITGIK